MRKTKILVALVLIMLSISIYYFSIYGAGKNSQGMLNKKPDEEQPHVHTIEIFPRTAYLSNHFETGEVDLILNTYPYAEVQWSYDRASDRTEFALHSSGAQLNHEFSFFYGENRFKLKEIKLTDHYVNSRDYSNIKFDPVKELYYAYLPIRPGNSWLQIKEKQNNEIYAESKISKINLEDNRTNAQILGSNLISTTFFEEEDLGFDTVDLIYQVYRIPKNIKYLIEENNAELVLKYKVLSSEYDIEEESDLTVSGQHFFEPNMEYNIRYQEDIPPSPIVWGTNLEDYIERLEDEYIDHSLMYGERPYYMLIEGDFDGNYTNDYLIIANLIDETRYRFSTELRYFGYDYTSATKTTTFIKTIGDL